MELTEEHIIRSTSPNDLTMEQRERLTIKFANLVARAKGYEPGIGPDESKEEKREKMSGKRRRVKSECG